MKKIIAATIVVLIFCFVIFMLWQIVQNKTTKKVNTGKLEKIELISKKGDIHTIFQSDKPIVVLYFKTKCQYCIDEITTIAENIEEFDNVNLFLVSSESQEDIAEFTTNFEIDKLYYFYDKTGELKKALNIKSYPSSFIFSKNKKLIKQFKGAVSIDKIISEIPNE